MAVGLERDVVDNVCERGSTPLKQGKTVVWNSLLNLENQSLWEFRTSANLGCRDINVRLS